jgi:hypothetical protein
LANIETCALPKFVAPNVSLGWKLSVTRQRTGVVNNSSDRKTERRRTPSLMRELAWRAWRGSRAREETKQDRNIPAEKYTANIPSINHSCLVQPSPLTFVWKAGLICSKFGPADSFAEICYLIFQNSIRKFTICYYDISHVPRHPIKIMTVTDGSPQRCWGPSRSLLPTVSTNISPFPLFSLRFFVASVLI